MFTAHSYRPPSLGGTRGDLSGMNLVSEEILPTVKSRLKVTVCLAWCVVESSCWRDVIGANVNDANDTI